MDQKAKRLPSLMVLGLCTQCVTPKTGVALSEDQKVLIGCRYISEYRSRDISQVECTIDNHNNAPARIKIEKVELDDPHAQIIPADSTKIGNYQTLQNVVIILGVVVIIVALVALATKSKANYFPSVRVNVPYTPPTQTISPTAVTGSKAPFIDTIEIPAYRHAILEFRTQHGAIRPATLVLYLDGVDEKPHRVPIKSPSGQSSGRSAFDY